MPSLHPDKARIMSVSISVSLLSGRTASLEEDLDASVANLKRRAEVALAVGGVGF